MSIREDIEALEAGYLKAFNEGNAAACAAFYAEDSLYAACGSEPVRGRRAIEELHAEVIASGLKILALRSTDVAADGRLAFAVETIETDQGNTTALLVFERQEDGAWRIRAEAEVTP